MRDTSKPLRLAVFNCLNGNLGKNVYDEKKKVADTDTNYVLLSTQQETPIEENDCTWINKSMIDIEIIQKTGSEVSKDTIDDDSNLILTLLMPTPQTLGWADGNGLQYANWRIESTISRNLSISETESILQKIIRFSVQIIQQT